MSAISLEREPLKRRESGGLEYWMALNDLELEVDRFGIRGLLDKGIDVEALFHRDLRYLRSELGNELSAVKWEVEQFRKVNLEEYSKAKEDLLKKGARIIRYTDEIYPQSLKKSEPRYPLVLYHKGSLLDFNNCVAITGTRNPSSYAREKIRKLSQLLAREGYTIVSGLALGSDTEAHQGVLDIGGRTVAVIPNIEIITPWSNQKLAEDIMCNGAVISPGSPISSLTKDKWAKRNKIISGLSKCLCTAVSTESRGTYHQVNFALKQGVKVFALKPPSDDHLAYFAFKKLLDMGATPFESENEVLDYLRNLKIN